MALASPTFPPLLFCSNGSLLCKKPAHQFCASGAQADPQLPFSLGSDHVVSDTWFVYAALSSHRWIPGLSSDSPFSQWRSPAHRMAPIHLGWVSHGNYPNLETVGF